MIQDIPLLLQLSHTNQISQLSSRSNRKWTDKTVFDFFSSRCCREGYAVQCSVHRGYCNSDNAIPLQRLILLVLPLLQRNFALINGDYTAIPYREITGQNQYTGRPLQSLQGMSLQSTTFLCFGYISFPVLKTLKLLLQFL